MSNKIFSNNNYLIFDIINELQQIIISINDNIINNKISNIIFKFNLIINDNKKNTELITNKISKLQNQLNNNMNILHKDNQ